MSDAVTAPSPEEQALLDRLRDTLEEARNLAAHLEASYGKSRWPADAVRQIQDLERRLAAYEDDVRELTFRLVDTEQQANQLLGLYSGLYQLHATLDPARVCSAISDVVTNLLGAERYALLLFESNDRGSNVRIALVTHPDDLAPLSMRDRYIGGDPMIDGALRDGRLRLSGSPGPNAVAAIPLSVDEQPVGALVVFKLLDHRSSLGPDDEPLIELLAVHAASALHSAQMHTSRSRRRE